MRNISLNQNHKIIIHLHIRFSHCNISCHLDGCISSFAKRNIMLSANQNGLFQDNGAALTLSDVQCVPSLPAAFWKLVKGVSEGICKWLYAKGQLQWNTPEVQQLHLKGGGGFEGTVRLQMGRMSSLDKKDIFEINKLLL